MSIRETLDESSFFDQAVVEHGFTPSNRDYRLAASICGQSEVRKAVKELHTYSHLFKLCVEAHDASNVSPSAISTDDVFLILRQAEEDGPSRVVPRTTCALRRPIDAAKRGAGRVV